MTLMATKMKFAVLLLGVGVLVSACGSANLPSLAKLYVNHAQLTDRLTLTDCRSGGTVSVPVVVRQIEIPEGQYCGLTVHYLDGDSKHQDVTFDTRDRVMLGINGQGAVVLPAHTAEVPVLPEPALEDLREVSAQWTQWYNKDSAVAYARAYAETSNMAPWSYFNDNDCTNFISQSVLAGMTLKSTALDNYLARKTYQDTMGNYRWYFDFYVNKVIKSLDNTWVNANLFMNYARAQNDYRFAGMNFQFITRDSATQALNVDAVRVGDVIFAERNGEAFHTMMVTRKDGNSRYEHIKVSYHTRDKLDNSLSAVNVGMNYPNFWVYRPIGFTR